MKKRFIAYIMLLSFLILTIPACQDYVTSVDPLIDQAQDDLLTSENQIPFIINGVFTEFTDAVEQTMMLSGLLSDETIFDNRVPNATFPTFDNIDRGEITLDDNSIDGCFNAVGEMRFVADNLVERVDKITFEDAALEARARFVGNFFGGVARMFYAQYFAIDENTPGGVIDAGPFIPQADMYNLAVAKFTAALTHADAYQAKVVNTLLARIYLNQNNYATAATYAASGMVSGDAPYQALYDLEDANWWWTQGGRGRSQVVMDFKYKEMLDADPEEGIVITLGAETKDALAEVAAATGRLFLDPILSNDGSMTFYRQGTYLEETSSINFVTWQENNLILAECALNGQAGDALALVNEVRQSHGISDLAAVDMAVLKLEREKELVNTGARLSDQHRWNEWHLPAGRWKYLPIPDNERNANPNID